MAKSRNGGAAREAAKRAKARALSTGLEPSDETLDEIFARLRTGAANVAGVTFQISVAGLLLAGGRSLHDGLPTVVEIRPEGFEDVDCRLRDGGWLLVQCKQRSSTRPFGLSEIASIVAHASVAETARDYDGEVTGFAIVTNGTFAVPATGWGSTLSANDSALVSAVENALAEADRDTADARGLVARTRLIALAESPAHVAQHHLELAYELHPAAASIARAQLSADIATLSSTQRGAEVAAAQTRSVGDLDSMVSRLVETIDVAALDDAVREGVCEFADFAHGTADTESQFFSGVRVVPGHIAANRDVIRVPECESVLAALEDSNHVLIVGPSGTGKSGLLWRSAAMLQDGPMILRVLRVGTQDDALDLVRYVRLLGTSAERRVIVCVDDLGRAATEYWAEARDRLLEIPGVVVLGACRQEDLLASISTGATLLESGLSTASALRIYDRIRANGIPLTSEPEEAIARSAGLLMEFVAIATTGRRIRDVLSRQVESLRAAGELVALDSLRLVCAMHTLGREVPAARLPELLGQTESSISRGLTRLQDEHLVTSEDGVSWRGLHDLRAEVLLDLLHQTPPPTLPMTYARAIAAADIDVHPVLFRRASLRVIRTLTQTADPTQGRRLHRFQAALQPLADAIAADIESLLEESGRRDIALMIASLVDSAERLDVIAYVGATLNYIERGRPSSVDVSSYYLMAYSSRFSRIFDGNNMFQHLVTLGEGLPDWSGSARTSAIEALNADAIESVLTSTSIDSAIRFSERLEGFATVSSEVAARVYRQHEESTSDSRSLIDADLLAQLVATLARLSGLDPESLAEAFGPPLERARWAARADDFAFEATVELKPISELPASPSNLARQSVYSDTEFCEASVRAFARTAEGSQPARAYDVQAGGDPASFNSQAVFLAQRLFDACPEADVVSVELVFADMSNQLNGMRTDGQKRMRSGVVPRRVDTERSIAVQVAVVELTSAELWSGRCRSQAAIVRDLLQLIDQVPARLGDIDNSRRRSEWIALCEATAGRVARLPGLPIDRTLLDSLNEQFPLAADFDRKLREASRDTSHKAVDLISGSLLQVARGLDDPGAIGGAGMRLAGAKKILQDARDEGRLPEYAGVGALLPESLDRATTTAARLLAGFGRGDIEPRRMRSATLDVAETLSRELAEAHAERSLAALESVLGTEMVRTRLVVETNPADPAHDLKIVALVAPSDWAAAEDRLRRWTTNDRAAANFKSKAELAVVVEDRVVPIGLAVWSDSGNILPLRETELEEIASAFDTVLIGSHYQELAAAAVQELVVESYRRVRAQRRPADWPSQDDGRPLGALPGFDHDDPTVWQRAVESLRELRSLVEAQSDGDESLAAAMAGVDIANPSDTSSRFVQLAASIRIDAIDADLASS